MQNAFAEALESVRNELLLEVARTPEQVLEAKALRYRVYCEERGYEAGHYAVSMKMAEASLLPAMRKAEADTLLVADGTSCRHQIADGAQRTAVHAAALLASLL